MNKAIIIKFEFEVDGTWPGDATGTDCVKNTLDEILNRHCGVILSPNDDAWALILQSISVMEDK